LDARAGEPTRLARSHLNVSKLEPGDYKPVFVTPPKESWQSFVWTVHY